MKTKLLTTLFVSTFMAVGTAQAYVISSLDEVDQILDAAFLSPSSDAEELAFINATIDPDIATYEKIVGVNTLDPALGESVDGYSNLFAFELAYASDYYLIKNASCKADDIECTNTAVIQNNSDYGWAVLDLDALALWGFKVGGDLQISHAVSFGDVKVPEPATLGLLALGLMGIGAARRRQTS